MPRCTSRSTPSPMTYISPRVPHPTASCPSQALAKRVTARGGSLGAPFPVTSMRPGVTQLSREPWVHRVSQSALSVLLQGEGGAALEADEDEDAGALEGSSGAGVEGVLFDWQERGRAARRRPQRRG